MSTLNYTPSIQWNNLLPLKHRMRSIFTDMNRQSQCTSYYVGEKKPDYKTAKEQCRESRLPKHVLPGHTRRLYSQPPSTPTHSQFGISCDYVLYNRNVSRGVTFKLRFEDSSDNPGLSSWKTARIETASCPNANLEHLPCAVVWEKNKLLLCLCHFISGLYSVAQPTLTITVEYQQFYFVKKLTCGLDLCWCSG